MNVAIWTMSALGHKQTFRSAIAMSALAPKADIARGVRYVRFVPIADSGQAQLARYSITSSARARSVGGIVTPSAFAVFKLMARSNLVGCSTGRSPASAPFKMRST